MLLCADLMWNFTVAIQTVVCLCYCFDFLLLINLNGGFQFLNKHTHFKRRMTHKNVRNTIKSNWFINLLAFDQNRMLFTTMEIDHTLFRHYSLSIHILLQHTNYDCQMIWLMHVSFTVECTFDFCSEIPI